MMQRAARGLSLTELLVVIALLSLIAAVALPGFSAAEARRVELAAAELAEALRFARAEALRTGTAHGAAIDTANGRVSVGRVDSAASPAVLVLDVRHPVTKQPYAILLEAPPTDFRGGVSVAASHRAGCNDVDTIVFDAGGTPWCLDPAASLLQTMTVTLDAAGRRSRVSIDGVSGRVRSE